LQYSSIQISPFCWEEKTVWPSKCSSLQIIFHKKHGNWCPRYKRERSAKKTLGIAGNSETLQIQIHKDMILKAPGNKDSMKQQNCQFPVK